MITKYLKYFLLILVMPNLSIANPGYWMPEAKEISSIILEGGDDGKGLVIIKGGVPTEYIPSDCREGGDGTYNTIPLNTDKGKGLYSTVLAAHLSGKKIKLALSCIGSRPLITHLWLF